MTSPRISSGVRTSCTAAATPRRTSLACSVQRPRPRVVGEERNTPALHAQEREHFGGAGHEHLARPHTAVEVEDEAAHSARPRRAAVICARFRRTRWLPSTDEPSDERLHRTFALGYYHAIAVIGARGGGPRRDRRDRRAGVSQTTSLPVPAGATRRVPRRQLDHVDDELARTGTKRGELRGEAARGLVAASNDDHDGAPAVERGGEAPCHRRRCARARRRPSWAAELRARGRSGRLGSCRQWPLRARRRRARGTRAHSTARRAMPRPRARCGASPRDRGRARRRAALRARRSRRAAGTCRSPASRGRASAGARTASSDSTPSASA